MKTTRLQEKIIQKYKLKDEQMITRESLEIISEKEEILLRDIVLILGCYQGILYKDSDKYTKINLNKNRNIREQIMLIKIDLKYLKEYGARSYNKSEIIEICKNYGVSLEDFLTYIRTYKICFYENMEILLKNKNGLWIGESPKLSEDFISKNFSNIEQKIIESAIKINRIYEIGKEEDLIDIGINKILKMGDVERNLSFDEQRIIGKMLYKARLTMIDYAIDYIKNFKDVEMEEIKYYEHYLEDNNIEEWLYPIEFNINQRLILEELIRNLYNEFETRLKIFRNIYQKLHMDKFEFFNELNGMQELILKFNKAKVCDNGRVIINV